MLKRETPLIITIGKGGFHLKLLNNFAVDFDIGK